MRKIIFIIFLTISYVFCMKNSNNITGHLNDLKKKCNSAKEYERQCPDYLDDSYKKESNGRMHIITRIPGTPNPEKIRAKKERRKVCGEYENKISKYYNL